MSMLLECCGFDTVSPDDQAQVDTVGKTLECDYDLDPTVLYQAIEEKAWGAAMKILSPDNKSYEAGESPEEQARTWVSRHEKDGDLRWSQLPLHAALIFGAPFELVERLVELYPPGLKSKDDQAMLPLHLAFRYGASDESVYYLLQKYPYAINVGGYKSRFPLECARKDGPKYTRALIIHAYINKTLAEMNSKVTKDEKVLGEQIKELEEDLNAEKLVVEKLKRENEMLKVAGTAEAFEAEKTKVVGLQRQLDVMASANKKLAKSEVITKAKLDGKKKSKSPGDLSASSSAASAVAQKAQAEAEAEMKKKEAADAKKEKEDKLEDMRNQEAAKVSKKPVEKESKESDIGKKKEKGSKRNQEAAKDSKKPVEKDSKQADEGKKEEKNSKQADEGKKEEKNSKQADEANKEEKKDDAPPVEKTKSNSSSSTVDTDKDTTPEPKIEEKGPKVKRKWSRRFSRKKKEVSK